jgi:hypothetical protein
MWSALIKKSTLATRFLGSHGPPLHLLTYTSVNKMAETIVPLDEVALKKESKKTDKKVKKDKKKVKEARQVDAGLQLFKGKNSELDGLFGKGVSTSDAGVTRR